MREFFTYGSVPGAARKGRALPRLWVSDPEGKKVAEMTIEQSAKGLSELGRWLRERQAEGIELWAAIEKPHGRVVDFLLDRGVVVYPINPKALDRARDRFRMSQSKSDLMLMCWRS